MSRKLPRKFPQEVIENMTTEDKIIVLNSYTMNDWRKYNSNIARSYEIIWLEMAEHCEVPIEP